MNFSVPNAKKFAPLLTIVIAQLVFQLSPGARLRAQVAAQPAPASTLQERMQKSLTRQMDSIAAMQRSVSAQQQAVRHQNGELAGQGFFTLPAPASMPSSLLERREEAIEEAIDVDRDESEDAAQSQPLEEAAPAPRETHPGSAGGGGTRVEVPWIDSLPVPLVGIPDAPALAPAPIAGIVTPGVSGDNHGVAWDLSLEGFLLRQFGNDQDKSAVPPVMTLPEPVPGQNGKDNGTAAGHSPLPRGAGAVDYLRQILDLSLGGSSLFGDFSGVR